MRAVAPQIWKGGLSHDFDATSATLWIHDLLFYFYLLRGFINEHGKRLARLGSGNLSQRSSPSVQPVQEHETRLAVPFPLSLLTSGVPKNQGSAQAEYPGCRARAGL